MKTTTEIKRKIYGVASKYDFYRWYHMVYVFDTKEQAIEWLNEAQFGCKEKKLMTKTNAIKLVGKKAVEDAFTLVKKDDGFEYIPLSYII